MSIRGGVNKKGAFISENITKMRQYYTTSIKSSSSTSSSRRLKHTLASSISDSKLYFKSLVFSLFPFLKM